MCEISDDYYSTKVIRVTVAMPLSGTADDGGVRSRDEMPCAPLFIENKSA